MPILPTRFPVKNHRAASSVPILGIKIKSLAGRQGPLGLDPCPCLWPCPALLPRPCPQNCSRTDQDQRPSFFLCCLSLHVSSGTTSSRKPLLTCLRLSKLLLLWVLQSPRLSNHSIIFGVFAMFPRASLWQTGESVRTPPGFSQSPPSLWYQAHSLIPSSNMWGHPQVLGLGVQEAQNRLVLPCPHGTSPRWEVGGQ